MCGAAVKALASLTPASHPPTLPPLPPCTASAQRHQSRGEFKMKQSAAPVTNRLKSCSREHEKIPLGGDETASS